jgi:hypothetical protein
MLSRSNSFFVVTNYVLQCAERYKSVCTTLQFLLQKNEKLVFECLNFFPHF